MRSDNSYRHRSRALQKEIGFHSSMAPFLISGVAGIYWGREFCDLSL